MSRTSLKILVVVIIAVSGIAGAVLWFASYFIGLVFVGLALILFFVHKRLSVKADNDYRRELRKQISTLLIPLAGIVIAVIIGGILMLATGYDPWAAYKALFYGGFVKNWHVSVLNSVPLMFTGLSIALAFKAGLFNIGAEGQYYVGAMAATFFGIYLKLPGILAIPIIFIVSAAVAGAYNFIPALLKVKTGAHEVITTMMFAHIARYLSSIFIRGMGGDPNTSKHAYVTWPILESSELPRFQQFLPNANYRVHMGIIIAIAVAFLVYYFLRYTKYGFEIRAVGHNPLASRTQGISVSANVYRSLLMAGMLAGLAGVTQIVGLDHKFFENLNAGYGWNGISVALLASNHPIGVIFTSLLWGALDAGGQYMARTEQTPNAIVEIIKGIILFLVVARYIYSYLGNRLRRKKALV